jgi:hypothetical protein
MRHGWLLVAVAACGGRSAPAPAPIGNQTEEPRRDWRPTAEQREQLAAAIAEARAAAEQEETEACLAAITQIEPAWLGSELDAQALEAAMACTNRSDDFCDHYVDDEPFCALQLEVDLAPRRAWADAVVEPCGFGGRVVSTSIPGEPDRCVAIEPGPDEEGACPRVVVLERARGAPRVVDVERVGESFLDSPSDCCHASQLAARRDGDAVRIVLSSDGPARDCFGGTAAIDQFEVYRLDGDRFVLEAQLGVSMH